MTPYFFGLFLFPLFQLQMKCVNWTKGKKKKPQKEDTNFGLFILFYLNINEPCVPLRSLHLNRTNKEPKNQEIYQRESILTLGDSVLEVEM